MAAPYFLQDPTLPGMATGHDVNPNAPDLSAPPVVSALRKKKRALPPQAVDVSWDTPQLPPPAPGSNFDVPQAAGDASQVATMGDSSAASGDTSPGAFEAVDAQASMPGVAPGDAAQIEELVRQMYGETGNEALLADQLAQARALRHGIGQQRYHTGMGAALGGLGDALYGIRSYTLENETRQKQEENIKKQADLTGKGIGIRARQLGIPFGYGG